MMYLNVNMNVGLQDTCTTPRTPEILNSLMALSNPFDTYTAGDLVGGPPLGLGSPPLATSPSDAGHASYPSPPSSASPASSTASSCSSSGSSPAPNKPTNRSHCRIPVRSRAHSIQHTRSQLIKEGLKLTIQTKRMATGQDQVPIEPKIPKREEVCDFRIFGDEEMSPPASPYSELTQEDEERRRRRRERNKIAATKCRNKKKEKTIILVQESECLEGQNVSLKTEIQKLEAEKQRLMDILSIHSQTCAKNATPISDNSGSSSTTTTSTNQNGNSSSYTHTHSHSHPSSCSYPNEAANGYCTTHISSPNTSSTSCVNSYQYSSCSFDQGSGNPNAFLGYSGLESGCVAL